MLGASYVDAGAGVASDGSTVYFTLDVGYIAGSPGNGVNTAGPGAPVAPSTVVAFYPVLVSTPGPDGSIIHLVQPGQALWNIAAAYKVNLQDVLNLNGLGANPIIYPGDKILIQPPNLASTTEATKPASATPKPTEFPTPTHQPTDSPTPPAETVDKPASHPDTLPSAKADPIMIGIAILVSGGTLLIVIGNLIKRAG